MQVNAANDVSHLRAGVDSRVVAICAVGFECSSYTSDFVAGLAKEEQICAEQSDIVGLGFVVVFT